MVDNVDLLEQRHGWLLDRLMEERQITTNEAAAELAVSVDTIRRDLRDLHDRGLLRRVHGGAVPVSRLPESFTGRSAEEAATRPAIAAAIVERFKPGYVIGLDGGSTCVKVASMIPASLSLTVVTNNPVAAVALADHQNSKVILLGGEMDLTWMVTTGSDVVDAWRGFRLDIGVIGVCGLDADNGITTNSSSEVATKRALIAASSEVIVPLHDEKIGTGAPFVVAELDQLDTVITERRLPDSLRRRCRSAGIETQVASSEVASSDERD